MSKLMRMFAYVLLACSPCAAQTQQPIRVKCGGDAYVDSKQQAWAADYANNGGLVSSAVGQVKGTSDAALFQRGRMPTDTTPLIYTFPVSNGAYHVNLYFAELNPRDERTGRRTFDVKLQGNVVLQDFDVFKTVGANAALIKGEDIVVTDGAVKIELDNNPGHGRGIISAIEVTQTQSAPDLILNFAYPDGTPVSGTLNYTLSTSLLKLGGNTPLVNGKVPCVLFTSPQIVGIIGQIQVTLSLTDSVGHQLWEIGMTMDPASVNFGSIQSSSLNVTVQKL